MRVVTQNVQALPLMPHRHVLEDVRATAKAADVVCWQEVRPLRYRFALKRLPKGTWSHYMGPRSGGVPISWRSAKFELIEKGSVLLHPGKAKVCERRYVTYVLLRDLASGQLLAVVNAHYVSKAWSNRLSREAIAERQGIWNAGNEAHVELLARLEAAGYAIVGGGDFNRLSPYPVVGRQVGNKRVRYATHLGSIDRLYVVNGDHAKWSAHIISDTLRDRHSDHAGRRITLQLTRRPM
jgi:endonuclease/exonuclease/phosphatase family metal-dependent hydrolase